MSPQIIEVAEELYVGRSLFENHTIMRLEPLLIATENGWKPVEDGQHLFPPKGSVFTVDKAALDRPKGTMLLFRVELNPRPRSAEDHDLYRAIDVRDPIEAIDLSATGRSEATRYAVVERGLDLGPTLSLETIILIESATCVRLSLAKDPDTGRWRPAHLEPLEHLDVLAFDRTSIEGANFDGRRFVLPGRDPATVVSRVNWSPDADFLPKVVRKLKHTAPFQNGGDMHDLGRRAIERLGLALQQAGLLSSDPFEDAATRERLDSFLPTLEARLDAACELAKALLENPTVTAQIERECELTQSRLADELRKELEPKVRAELEIDIREITVERDRLSQELVDVHKDYAMIRSEVEAMSSERERLRTALTGEVGSFVGAISDVVGVAKRYGLGSYSGDHHSPAPWAVPSEQPSKAITTAELAIVLAGAERDTALPERRIIQFDALVRAGEIPILFGPGAERLLEIYSSYVTAGSLSRTSIDPATIGMDDLWREAVTGAPTGFAFAWKAALQDPGFTVLAVLDDLDTASLGHWLPRFASFLRSHQRPANLLVVATLTLAPVEGKGLDYELLTHGFPFEVEANVGAIAAAIMGEADGGAPKVFMRVIPPYLPVVRKEDLATLSVALMQSSMSPTVAIRAARIFRSASATMSSEDARAFAIEAAELVSTPCAPSAPITPNARSFAAIVARAGMTD